MLSSIFSNSSTRHRILEFESKSGNICDVVGRYGGGQRGSERLTSAMVLKLRQPQLQIVKCSEKERSRNFRKR